MIGNKLHHYNLASFAPHCSSTSGYGFALTANFYAQKSEKIGFRVRVSRVSIRVMLVSGLDIHRTRRQHIPHYHCVAR